MEQNIINTLLDSNSKIYFMSRVYDSKIKLNKKSLNLLKSCCQNKLIIKKIKFIAAMQNVNSVYLVNLMRRIYAAKWLNQQLSTIDLNTIPLEYNIYNVKKANGKIRKLYEPNPKLKILQSIIAEYFKQCGFWLKIVHGFVPFRSTYSNAQTHIESKFFIKLDIKNAFESSYIPVKNPLNEKFCQLLRKYCFIDNVNGQVLPTGSPSSPWIFNWICSLIIDPGLMVYCRNINATVTRYADDITISFRENPQVDFKHIIRNIKSLISPYKLNYSKIKIYRNRCKITGYVINNGKITIPKWKRKLWRAMVHNDYTGKRRLDNNKKNGIIGYLNMSGYKVEESGKIIAK